MSGEYRCDLDNSCNLKALLSKPSLRALIDPQRLFPAVANGSCPTVPKAQIRQGADRDGSALISSHSRRQLLANAATRIFLFRVLPVMARGRGGSLWQVSAAGSSPRRSGRLRDPRLSRISPSIKHKSVAPDHARQRAAIVRFKRRVTGRCGQGQSRRPASRRRASASGA
jgi:hypothetical protein